MEGVKNFLQSKTIWGAIFVVLATVAQAMHIDFGDASGWTEAFVQLFGAGLAVYGRIVAVKKIG